MNRENEEKEEKNNILERNILNKKINNYRKLNKIQKKELIQFGKEIMCKILSKSISAMCCFLVPQNVIEDIIIYYGAHFKFDYETKCYLKNIMTVKNMKVMHLRKICSDKVAKLNNKILLVSSVSTFYPIENYLILFLTNKKIYPKLKKNIFLNLISDKRFSSIDSHIKLWKEYLQIDKIKKNYVYENIKNDIKKNR